MDGIVADRNGFNGSSDLISNNGLENGNASEGTSGTNDGDNDLLHYLPQYKVLLCKACHYAIQPSAISRHLKERHRVYRQRRQKQLDFVSKLELSEPRDVHLPPRDSAPVPYLPIEAGFACTHEECNYRCVTLKRMKRHWMVEHGRPARHEADWRRVSLQTFFRGSHLRYFEVHAPLTDVSKRPAGTLEKVVKRTRTGMNHVEEVEEEEDAANEDLVVDPTEALFSPVQSLCNTLVFHLDDLALLTHFFHTTSLTVRYSGEPLSYWNKEVPNMACSCLFLMHGLMAVSAVHQAYLHPEQRDKFMLQATHHQDLALPFFRSATARELTNTFEESAVKAFTRLVAIQGIAAMSLIGPAPEFSSTQIDGDRLLAVLRFGRGGCPLTTTLVPAEARQEVSPDLDLDAAAWERLRNLVDFDALYQSLQRKGKSLRRPPMDALVGSFAFQELRSAFGIAFAAPSSSCLWDAMEYWPSRISEHFFVQVQERQTEALVLCAYFILIIKQLSHFWFMEGHSEWLLDFVMEHLEPADWHLIRIPLFEIKGARMRLKRWLDESTFSTSEIGKNTPVYPAQVI